MNLLATDLDGTFIPRAGDLESTGALEKFHKLMKNKEISLFYISGRDLALIEDAIDRYRLPTPQWISADVGTTIYIREDGEWKRDEGYASKLRDIVKSDSGDEIHKRLRAVSGVEPQESSRQGEFKLSFYTSIEREEVLKILERVTADLPYKPIYSFDPEREIGLIDILPEGVSKLFALQWFVDKNRDRFEKFAFAGDSGNDSAVFESGFPSIMVGNTPEDVVISAQKKALAGDFEHSLYRAKAPSTAGVLEGSIFFKLF